MKMKLIYYTGWHEIKIGKKIVWEGSDISDALPVLAKLWGYDFEEVHASTERKTRGFKNG